MFDDDDTDDEMPGLEPVYDAAAQQGAWRRAAEERLRADDRRRWQMFQSSMPGADQCCIGKSWIWQVQAYAQTDARSAEGGVFQNTTTNAQSVDSDADHEVVIYEEMDSELLFSNHNTNDSELNFAMARLTHFYTVTQRFFLEDEPRGVDEVVRADPLPDDDDDEEMPELEHVIHRPHVTRTGSPP